MSAEPAAAAPPPAEAEKSQDPVGRLLTQATKVNRAGNVREAMRLCHRALAIDPDSPAALHLLGVIHSERGDLAEAIGLIRRALRLAPGFVQARLNLGLVLLRAGEYREGWPYYEERLRLTDPKARQRVILPDLPYPRWRGGDIRGKRLLLVREQGFGDQIQFARYAEVLAARGAQVDLLVRPRLTRLLATARGVHKTLGEPPTDPKLYDLWAPMLSVPFLLGGGEEAIPRKVPYVSAAPQAVEAWRARIADYSKGRPVVGLMWAGNAHHVKDHKRSIAFKQLEPLLRLPGLAFASFQLGPPAEQGAEAVQRGELLNLAPELNTFLDTAAIAPSIDLLISVDTAIIHLFGACGRPAWAMLANDSDWRWLRFGEETVWYPATRLFRQTLAETSMAPVIQRVAERLAVRRPSGAA